VLALGAGAAGDQLFRDAPLGMHYRTAAERVLAAPVAGLQPPAAINVVATEDVDALLSRPDVIILDGRPRIFFEIGHLPGARSLSREQFEADFASLESILRVPGRTLLIYCSDADCEDGALVAKALQERGFGSLLIYADGYAAWEDSGRRVEVAP